MGRETKKKNLNQFLRLKRGVPKNVKGASNPMVRESEIIETKKLYAAGQLTAEDGPYIKRKE